MTLGLIMAVVMNGGAYFFSDKIALMSSGAQPVSREQLPRLYEVMERLCGKAGLPFFNRRRTHLRRAAILRTRRLP